MIVGVVSLLIWSRAPETYTPYTTHCELQGQKSLMSIASRTRRPNGATQTFRRTSTATTNSTQAPQREMTANNGGASAQNVGVYVPPHISASRNGGVLDMRYAKTQLLDLFREQRDSRDLENGIAELYVGDVDGGGGVANGGATNRWSRREEPKTETAGGSEACWDRGGGIEPMGLFDLTEEEKEVMPRSPLHIVPHPLTLCAVIGHLCQFHH